jgi:phage tail-like protein
MQQPRPFAAVSTEDQWRRAAFADTALVRGEVMLAWDEEGAVDQPGDAVPAPAGLAFDAECRLYHSVPEEHRVERLLWAADPRPEATELFAPPEVETAGEFSTVRQELLLDGPSALAVDSSSRLYIAEPPARRIRIYDLWDRRLLETWSTAGIPVDLAATDEGVLALTRGPDALLRFRGRGGPETRQLPSGLTAPARAAVSPSGELFVLDNAGLAEARILSFARPPIVVARATDIEFYDSDLLAVARHPSEDFPRFRITPAAVDEIPPLKGRGYDGRGIVRTPDDRIGFWTANGFRHAVVARLRYRIRGRVTTFRLDAGDFQTNWGRLFLDACIPAGTSVQVHCATADEPPDEPATPRTPPSNLSSMTIYRPDLSPPMPPVSFVPADEEIAQALHERNDSGQPWAPVTPPDAFATYEAPVLAGAGRFLWVTALLSGNSRSTPRLRAIRAEFPSHDYLRRLPKAYSRDAAAESFLRRYLAPFEGVLGELEAKGVFRHALLDPRGAPESVLPWLAGFVGLLFDERWPAAARRTLIEESAYLWRFRGTVPGLTRFLEIYLGLRPILIEKFRLRGLGGAIAGSGAAQSSSVLGAGFRVGGSIGEEGFDPLSGTLDDAFETHAHRFTVVAPRLLSTEQMDVVRHILDVHRPAHTLYDVCTVNSGMTVGNGLYVGLTSIVGPTGGFQQVQLDASLLGRDRVLGRARPGISPSGSRLGKDMRVG